MRTALEGKRWREVRRGVSAESATWANAKPSERFRLESLALGLTRDVVLTQSSAAAVHRLALLGVPPEVARARPREIPTAHRIAVSGVVVTNVERTVIDCARFLGFEAGVVTADSALRAGLCSPEALSELVAECRRWPGIALAANVVHEATHLAESVLESLSRVRLLRQGLPRPELQALIDTPSGECFRVDFLWREYGVIGEADGMGKYASVATLHAEKRRELALMDAGYLVVRWSWDEMRLQADLVAQRIRRAFTRSARPAI